MHFLRNFIRSLPIIYLGGLWAYFMVKIKQCNDKKGDLISYLECLYQYDKEEACKVAEENIKRPKVHTGTGIQDSESPSAFFDVLSVESQQEWPKLFNFYKNNCVRETNRPPLYADFEDLATILRAKFKNVAMNRAIDSAVLGEDAPQKGIESIFSTIAHLPSFISHFFSSLQNVVLSHFDDLTIRSFTFNSGVIQQQIHVLDSPYVDDTFEQTVFIGGTTVVVRGKSYSLGKEPLNFKQRPDRITTSYPGLFTATFNDPYDDTWLLNNGFLEILMRNQTGEEPIPQQILLGLSTFNVYAPTFDCLTDTCASTYWNRSVKILFEGEDNLHVLIHELLHHWDLSVTGPDRSQTDPSKLFRQISWKDKNTRMDEDYRDFFLKSGSSIFEAESSVPYGFVDCREDIAATGEVFFRYGAKMRQYVRAQMNIGNFEPAVKYVFVKHFPFGGMEYGLKEDNSSLTLHEVINKVKAWQDEYPGTIRQGTLQTLAEISNFSLSKE